MAAEIDLAQLLKGSRRTIARAISLVENDEAEALRLSDAVFSHTGNAYRLGVTGPPGAGKSTLTNKLALHARKQGRPVGIIAVDPTSPFTGGALLGDRVRMTDIEMDDGVYIRSMASRGSLGGLSQRALEAADILDAAGMDLVIMETVGVGQSELDIARAADSTVVVLVPESGDAIQAMKAGLMEIADVFVMNKSDRAGADQAVQALQTILSFRTAADWTPPVVKATASEGVGISDLAGAIAAHRQYLERTGLLQRRRRTRLEQRIKDLVSRQMHDEVWTARRQALLAAALDALSEGKRGLLYAADEIINDFRSHEGGA